MRVSDQIEKAGYFWLPSVPHKKIPGTLTIKDGGEIELETIGLFDETSDTVKHLTDGEFGLPRIVGQVETYGFVTLDSCFYTKFGLPFGQIQKSYITANKAYLGLAYEEQEPVGFTTFRFTFEGLNDWVGISGLKRAFEFETRSASITFTEPPAVTINLKDGMTLRIIFAWSFGSQNPITEANIEQQTYFQLVSQEMRPVEDFIWIAHKLNTLLCFAVDQTVCIQNVSGSYEHVAHDSDEDTAKLSARIFYGGLPYTSPAPTINIPNMLFRFPQISERSELIVNKWMEAYELLEPALNLYFATKEGSHKYVDGRFLALAQGLETYHRRTFNEKVMDDSTFNELINQLMDHCPEQHQKWLQAKLYHANEVSLTRRLKSIIRPYKSRFGTNDEREKLIRKIVDTRNYLTHYDEALREKASGGRDLWILCLRMESILQLHFLHILGFTEEEVQAVADNSRALQQKLTEL